MTNPNDPAFEIDAGKILAKLHLAGQQSIPNAIPVNTGIENPVAKADPAKPGNVEFNLDNKSREYQFAIMKILKYQVPIDISKNKKIADLNKKLEDLKKKTGKDTDKETKNESFELVNKKLLSLLFEADDKEDNKSDDKEKEESKEDKEIKKIQDQLLKEFDSYKLKEYKENKDSFEESVKSFNEAVEKENEERKNKRKEEETTLQKTAFDEIKTYFKTISGDQNASKIKQDEIVILNADIDGKIKDPTQFKDIKDFKITTDSVDKAIEKHEQKIQETKPNDWIQRNVMFAVGFSVQIESI